MADDAFSTVGTADEHELDQVFEVDFRSFSRRAPAAVVAEWRKSTELTRTVVTKAEGEVVGSAISLPTTMTLPGLEQTRTAAVVGVAVVPSHRRQGRLRAMMRYQLDDLRSRGEALAALYSSEGSIYGRYGYGPATFGARFRLDRVTSRLRAPVLDTLTGSVRMVDAAAAKEALPALLDEYGRTRAGEVAALPGEWMDLEGLESPEEAAQRFFAVYEENGQIDGCISYHVGPVDQAEPWPHRAVFVERLITATDTARAALWSFALGVDLVTEVRTMSIPLDEPLRWWLEDHRQLRTSFVGERTWVRLVDVEECLRRRQYEEQGAIVIEVEDEFCPWNTGIYRVTTAPGAAAAPSLPATVERVPRDPGRGSPGAPSLTPDVTLDVAALASVFLGGVDLMSLARGGRVRGSSEESLVRAARMFRTLRTPFCTTHF